MASNCARTARWIGLVCAGALLLGWPVASAPAAARSYTSAPATENLDGLGASGTVITPPIGWDAEQLDPAQTHQPGPGNGVATVTEVSLVADGATISPANGTASAGNPGTAGSADRAPDSLPKTGSGDVSDHTATVPPVPPHFTVTADPRGSHSQYNAVLRGITNLLGTTAAFHVDIGDYDEPPQENRRQIDAVFGANHLWYIPVGNHEVETPSDMDWVRAEYNNGNGIRAPLKNSTLQNGPAGSVETMYAVDYANAHLVFINEYWNGGTAAGSDVALDGDMVPALRQWLDADLKATTQPVKIVFGHEPAYLPARHNHAGDSLDLHAANRDAFWGVLSSNNVIAMMNGHTHAYYKLLTNGVWQIDAGNAGNDNMRNGYTFIDVILGTTNVQFDVWRDTAKKGTWLKSAESFSVPIPGGTKPPG
jgi:hypothetical protein